MPCNADKIYRNCQETFTLSGKPFIFTNSIRKDPSNAKKKTFPEGSVLYISGPKTLTAAANYPAVMYIPEGYVNYVGSKNNGTIFIINGSTSGILEGGVEKENTIVMSVKAKNIVADLHKETISYGGSYNIKLVNVYNYVSNSDSRKSVVTHCKTRLINARNSEVQQSSSNCQTQDYEVRVVNKKDVHYRGLKQTTFIVNEDSDNAMIVRDLSDTEKIKENMDVVDVQVTDITQLKVNENAEKGDYSLSLLANDTQNIIASIKMYNFKKLVVQVKHQGITESVIIQDKSLSDIVKDMRYQELNHLGKGINRETIQNSEKKLKAFIQASILDLELPNTYQAAKNIVDNSNLGVPISQVEVIKNYMGIPTEKAVIGGMYSDQIIVDFSYNNPDFTSGYQKYRDNGGSYDYNRYMTTCNYYQDITVEGEKEQHQYIVKLPEYDNTLKREISSFPVRLNLKIKNKAVPYQNIPYSVIDFAELNITDINSIGIKEGKRSYISECYSKLISDLTEDSLEIKDITVLGSEGTKWSLSIGLVDYFRGQEYQHVVLRMDNKFYKIDNANLKLEHIEVDPNSFRYYQPDEQGLQIYHNQPIDKNDIGLIDLKEKSILGFDMEVIGSNLLLLHKNNTIAEVENWSTYQPARKVMFAFNDTMVSSANCIVSTCNSEDIIAEFIKKKETLLGELLNAVAQDDLDKVKDFIKKGTNAKARYNNGWTLMHYAAYEGGLNIVKYLVEEYTSLWFKYNDVRTFSCNTALSNHLDAMKCLVGKENSIEIKDNSGRVPLHYAAYNGKLDVVEYFIDEEKIDASIKDNSGLTSLHYAVWGGYLEVAELLSKRVNVNDTDKNGKAPLHLAIEVGKLNMVELLLNRNASIEAKYNGKTPLNLAVQEGKLDIFKLLVDKHAKVTAKGISGEGILHFAAQGGNVDIVKLLLDMKSYSTKIDVRDRFHRTPLYFAAQSGNSDVVKLLLDRDASIKATDMNGQTLLDLAIQKDYKDVVEILKQAQLDLDRKLLTAAQDGNRNKVRGLIAKGANIDIKDKDDCTLLYSAAEAGDLDEMRFLLDNGANTKTKNGEYQATPLHGAVANYRPDAVKLLLSRDANVDAEDKVHWTPLHYAADTNRLDIVKLLVDANANLGATDDYGETPLDIARNKGHDNIAEYLEKKLNEKGEKPVQRRRRHHHGDHSRHHLSRKPLAIDLSNQPEIAASSGTRPSSWINGLLGWVKSSVGGLFYSRAALPEETLSTTSSISQVDAPIDVNGTIMLLDLLIRKVTGQKYIFTVDQSISPLEAQGYALNIKKGFRKVVEQAARDSKISIHRLDIDFIKVQEEITRKVMDGKFNEISGILNSYLEKACPGREAGCPGKLSPKKFEKFIAQFNKDLLNQSIEQILHNRDGRLEVDGAKQMNLEPQSYLSNASVQGHSKNKVSTCLSEIGVTKLGGNLNR